jgi:DNA repair protein RadC
MTDVPFLDLGPRERARLHGFDHLGDADLVAILLGTGTVGRPVGVVAAELLEASGGLVALARDGPWGETCDSLGLGEAKRARISAAFELGRRVTARRALSRAPRLACPDDVASWGLATLGALSHEELWLLALDARHALLATRRIGQGGSRGVAVSIRDVLRVALRAGATAFVLVHNHPSGDPTPSPEDLEMTRRVAEAATAVGLALVDHVIVGRDGHASLFSLGHIEAP